MPEPVNSESQAEDLRRRVFRAYESLCIAHAGYEDALAIAADTNWSSDGLYDLRQEGRAYAKAVTHYSAAVMTWLAFMDTFREDMLKLLPRSGEDQLKPGPL